MQRYILYALVISLFSINVHAQSLWTSVLVVDQNPSPYFNDWERDPSIGTLLVTTPAGTPETEFYCKLQIFLPSYKTGTPIIEGESSTLVIPSGPQSQVYRYSDIVDWKDVDYDKSLYETIVRSGRLLEGEYELRVLIYKYPKTSSPLLLTETSAFFIISYPNPPEIISPLNQAVITDLYPVFMWSPVIMPPGYTINYHLKIVERLNPSGSPERELEANTVHFETNITGLNNFTYPADALPFESGKEYIWQITAADENGFAASQNNGKSEVYTFSYGVKKVLAKSFTLDQLLIEENFVYLNDVRSLEMTEDPLLDQYILNGNTSLEIRISGMQPILISADVEDLKFQKDFYTPPNFTSGTIKANLFPGDIPESVTGPYFQPQDIEYSPVTGFTIGGLLNLPGPLGSYPFTTRFNFSSGQISGDASVFGSPLFTVGDDIFKLMINTAEVHFSDPEIKFQGEIELFGEKISCSLSDLLLSGAGIASAGINCNISNLVSLLQGQDIFKLNLSYLEGNIQLDVNRNVLTYNLNTSGGFDFQVANTSIFGADVALNIKPQGVVVTSFSPRGNAGIIPIDLGWFKLNPENMSVKMFGYNSGNWDFSLSADINMTFPSLDNLTLPQITGASFGSNGLTIPEINLPNLSLPRVSLGLCEFEFTGIKMPSFTLDWQSLASGTSQNGNVNFDFNLRFPDLSAGFPDELRTLNLPFQNIAFNNGRFSFSLPELNFPEGITLSFGEGINFHISGFSGSINGDLTTNSFNPDFIINGSFTLPSFLGCEQNLQVNGLHLSAEGKIVGKVDNIIPECPLKFGMFTLQVTGSSLDFTAAGSEQNLIFSGTGNIQFDGLSGTQITAAAEFSYDLIRNTIIVLRCTINEPFALKIPTDNPVLVFNINTAVINQDGMIINGRQSLQLSSGTAIGATFDNLNIKWNDMSISGGSVLFDTPFSLKAGIEGGQIIFQAVPPGTALLDEGLILNLPDETSINQNGFSVSGNASAQLIYQGRNLQNLSAVFSDNFSVSLNSFSIKEGHCEIYSGQNRIALINTDGFLPDMSFLATELLPEKLPLPDLSIAYLQLKENGELLVDNSIENGNLRLKTKAGQFVKLVFPSLILNKPNAPEVDVTFDIVIDQLTKELISGVINAQIPNEQIADFDLSSAGIPFIIKKIFFGDVNGLKAFRLSGNLKLFNSEFAENTINLILSSDGQVSGNVDLTLNKDVSLIEGNEKIKFQITKITGVFNSQLLINDLSYSFNLDGNIKLRVNEQERFGALVKLICTQSGIEITENTSDSPQQLSKIDLIWIKLGLSDFKITSLGYNLNTGWSFEILTDVFLEFPGFNLLLPPINDVKLNNNGFFIPEYTIPQLSDSVHLIRGYGIKALAFRMQPFTFNWFHYNNESINWGFAFDFELSFPTLPAALRNTTVRILNAGYNKGIITGEIETTAFNPPIKIPFDEEPAYLIQRMTGILSDDNGLQKINVSLNGKLQLPNSLRCPNTDGIVDISTSDLNINSNGILSGIISNFVPSCPVNLGVGNLFITNSSLILEPDEHNNQSAVMDLQGNLKVPSSNDSITVSGNLKLSLIDGKIIDGEINIPGPIKFQLPKENPLFTFALYNAKLNKNGLLVNGEGNLQLPGDGTSAVTFNNLLIDSKTLAIKSGSISLTNDFAIKLEAETGSLKWSVINAADELLAENGVKLNLPENITIDMEGVHINGSASALIKWQDLTYADVSCIFAREFLVGCNPLAVKQGKAEFIKNNDTLAVLDQDGFIPGNMLKFVLPEKIPLPDVAIAYLKIKEGNNLLVRTEGTAQGLRIFSLQPVELGIPALNCTGSAAPKINFEMTVNPATWQIVSGSVSAKLNNPINFSGNGIPLIIDSVIFNSQNNSFALRANGKLILPSALNNLVFNVNNLSVSSAGLSGSFQAGSYNENCQPNETYIKSAKFNNAAEFKVQGININLAPGENSFRFSGDITTKTFSNGNDSTKIHYFAQWINGAFSFTLKTPDRLSLLSAQLQPITASLTFTEDNFKLLFDGVLSFPTIANDFSFSIKALEIDKNGMHINAIDILTEADYQSFEIFGAVFTLKNIGANKAVSFSFSQDKDTLYAILNGRIKFLNKEADFTNLTIGTNGKLTLGGAFLSGDFKVVNNYLTITRFGFAYDPTLKMVITGRVNLPKPVNELAKEFTIKIGADGSITGNGEIPLLEETEGLGGDDNSEYDLWLTTIDPTYLSLYLDVKNVENSAIKLVADLYFKDESKRVKIGKQIPLTPGLQINFNGDITWGNIEGTQNLGNLDWDMIQLRDLRAGINSDDGFKLSMSGKLGLTVGDGCISGGLDITGLQLDADGKFSNLGTAISGGDLSLLNIITLKVSDISYSSSPETIQIDGASFSTCGNSGSAGCSKTSKSVNVLSYFRFSGSIDIAGVANGSMKEFLAYKTNAGTSLIINNAHFEIPGVVDFTANMSFTQDDGSKLLFAGQGKFASYDITIVGKIAPGSFGMFLAAENLSIPVGPIMITGVGGGFFYNPENSDIDVVKCMSGLREDEQSKITKSTSSFSVFLFGTAALGSDNVMNGRVLVTLTDNFFSLDGKITLLNQNDRLTGTVHLAIGLRNGFAEGNINVDLKVWSLIEGNGNLSFYVYGTDAWGITGNVQADILKILHTDSELYIGNSGFLYSMSISAGFDIWIVEIEAGMTGKIWYTKNVSWGLYCKLWIDVEVLGGIASAEGWMEGGLIGSGSNFFIFGIAGLKAECAGLEWEGTVWARINSDGTTDADIGENSEYAKLINRAKNFSNDMIRKAKEEQEKIHSSLIASLSIPREDLNRAFKKIYNLGQKYRTGTNAERNEAEAILNSIINGEKAFGKPPSPDETALLNDIKNNVWAPQNIASLAVQNELNILHNEILAEVEVHNSRKMQLAAQLNQLTSDPKLTDLTSREFVLQGTPVENLSLNRPVFTERTGVDGKRYRTAVSQPGFNVNNDILQLNKTSLTEAYDASDDYERQIRERITAIENTLNSMDNILENSPDLNARSISREFWGFINKTQDFYRRKVEYYKNGISSLDGSLIWMTQNSNRISNMLTSKTSRIVSIDTIRSLGSWRYSKIMSLADDPTQLERMNESWASQNLNQNDRKSLCTQYGMNLLYNAPLEGITSIKEYYKNIKDSFADTSDGEVTQLAILHGKFTEAIDDLYDAKVLLVQNIYDIYDEYYYWKSHTNPGKQDVSSRQKGISLVMIENKRRELSLQLQVPVINSINISSTGRVYYNQTDLSWSASHPLGIKDYSIMFFNRSGHYDYGIFVPDDLPGSVHLEQGSGFNIGNLTSISRIYLRESPSSYFQVRARAGAGFGARRAAEFSVSMINAPGQNIVVSQMITDDTAPRFFGGITFPDAYRKIANGDTTYILNNSPTLNVTANAVDHESDIVENSYQLKDVNGTILKDWTSVGGRIDYSIINLNLQHGQTYTLSVRAKNGAGLTREISKDFLVDATGPSTPAYNSISLGQVSQNGSQTTEIFPPVPLPDLSASNNSELLYGNDYSVNSGFNNSQLSGFNAPPQIIHPTINFSWSHSTDAESDVSHYEYRLKSFRDPLRVTDWDSIGYVTSVSISRSFLTYRDSFYIEITALNKVKVRSNALTRGPYLPVDPTPPSRPAVAVAYGPTGGSAYLIFSEKSADPESGINGYQFAIGTRRGSTNIKSWGSPVDFKPEDIGAFNQWRLPNLNIPNGAYYISIRAKNNQNVTGLYCCTGLFIIDNSPPVKPAVNAVIQQSPYKCLKLNFSNISDPESGIQSIEFAIGTLSGNANVINWTKTNIDGPTSIKWDADKYLPGNTYYVSVRTINGTCYTSEINWTSFRDPSVIPPEAPVIRRIEKITNSFSQDQLKITFGNTTNQNPGITKVRFAIGTREKTTDIYSWHDAGSITIGGVLMSTLNRNSGSVIYIGAKSINADNLVSQETWISFKIP